MKLTDSDNTKNLIKEKPKEKDLNEMRKAMYETLLKMVPKEFVEQNIIDEYESADDFTTRDLWNDYITTSV